MRRSDSQLIDTNSHETATYGPALMNIALNLLRGQPVPPYNYVAQKVVSRKSVRQNPLTSRTEIARMVGSDVRARSVNFKDEYLLYWYSSWNDVPGFQSIVSARHHRGEPFSQKGSDMAENRMQ